MRILAVLCLCCCAKLFAYSDTKVHYPKKPMVRQKPQQNGRVPMDIQDQQRSTENTSAGRI